MIRTAFIIAVTLATFALLPAQAEDVTLGSLKISAPWARATPKGASVGGAYMKITNTGTATDRLIGGSTDVAGRFEVHEMSMDNGVMMMGLKEQLVQGQHFKATLEFVKAGKIDVDFAIEGVGAQSPGTAGGAMGGMKMK